MRDELSEHSHFEELCALAPVGEISPAEHRKLSEHLRECASCRDSYADFRELIHLDLPLVIAEENFEGKHSGLFSWLIERQFSGRFIARAKDRGLDLVGKREIRDIFWNRMAILSLSRFPYWQLMSAVVVVLFVALGVLSFKAKAGNVREGALAQEVQRLSDRNLSLLQQLEALTQSKEEVEAALSEIQDKSGGLGIRLRELEARGKTNDAALQTLDEQMTITSARASLAEERLKDAQDKVAARDQELVELRTSRAEADGSATGRQLQLADLSRRVKEQDNLIEKQQKLLEVDTDVRNLMAARNLHITDVFDVDGKGKKQSAFGRVFYTEGKSLIFYAFDLNPPKGASDKHSFQAWGQLTDSSTSAVNLGIFYVDDPAEKRWILKFDNPEVLSRLSAVFVTTEPRGGTMRPTGTKLMYAYLGHEPNHP